MKRSSVLLFAFPLLAVACGSSGGGSTTPPPSMDGGGEGGGPRPEAGPGEDAPAPVDNVATLSVNAGPSGANSADVPYVSVTICVPGTSTCQTVEDVIVDTGSSGVRILASALSSDIALPQQTAPAGGSLLECTQFDSGYTWGSIRFADVKVGGEVASRIQIQLVGDPEFASVPSSCSSSGQGIDSVYGLGGNGLFGINQIVADCGDICAGSGVPGAYYSCDGSSCSTVGVAVAAQVSNPVASFAKDNNGAVVEFPTVPALGAPTLAGQLIFGIGTEANNALGSAKVITVDQYGSFTTNFNGQSLGQSFIDSGSNSLAFDDSSIPTCAGELNFLFCPSSTLNLVAENEGLNGVTSSVSFPVANADTLFESASNTAFDDLAGPGIGGPSFDWGLPFFMGRNVFVAIADANTPGGKGPYFAY